MNVSTTFFLYNCILLRRQHQTVYTHTQTDISEWNEKL